MSRIPNVECPICGTRIYRRPAQIETGNVFCSRECSGKARRNTKPCPVCATPFFSRSSTCSVGCANTLRSKSGATNPTLGNASLLKKLQFSKHTDTWVCEECGYDNFFALELHHVIHRAHGGSDDFDNLQLLCPNCHVTHHRGDSRRCPEILLDMIGAID